MTQTHDDTTPTVKNSPGILQSEIESLKKSLEKSEDRYQSFLEEIEDGYIELDLAGRLLFFNTAFMELTGYSREKLKGMSYREYIDHNHLFRVFRAFNHVYKTGVPNKAFNYAIIRSDGTKRMSEISIALKRDLNGTIIGFRSIVRDITKRNNAEKELKRHRSRLEAIFRSVNDAIITVDNDMNVIEANTATDTICGIKVSELVGNVFTNCTENCMGHCHAVLKETLVSKSAIRDYRIECANKGHRHQKVSISTSPLLDSDNKFLGAVLVIKDITRLNDLERELKKRHRLKDIIGASSKMQDLFCLLEDLSDMEATVLITGESGTGKELAAKALHECGKRAFKPFVKVNCSALSENLLESELFGHVKGSFTGAISDSQGRFETANKGTILLDEIGDISPATQLKLLRVLQEREFEKVGQSEPIKVDIRVIASTNRNLRELVAKGIFREDLYYRLKVVEIDIPPLRERTEDIQLLVDHFIQKFNEKYHKTIYHVSDEVQNIFLSYDWPGNIRELEHAMERAFVLCRGDVIELEHIPPDITTQGPGHVMPIPPVSTHSREVLLETLKKTGWNKSKTAKLLGVNRRTIYRRIDKLNIQKPHELV